ncbi:hypothetical protein U9M48_038493 [Paspalum notatum var. saurae]|uniref:Uncharacterized protein n=1 Tax=Paspalum notatum var. saurae TaxID=547442 RepID=A0AAQ3XDL5_PASNO
MAVAASFLPRAVPLRRSSTSGASPPRLPIAALFSSSMDRLNSVAAEFSCASGLPLRRISMMSGMAPPRVMRSLFFSSIERFSSEVLVVHLPRHRWLRVVRGRRWLRRWRHAA